MNGEKRSYGGAEGLELVKQKLKSSKGTRWTWKTAHEAPGSGIVIVKKIDNEWRVLGLWARGGYDVPKGHLEQGECPLEAAKRESKEECNLSEFDFKWGEDYIIIDYLVLYLATTNQEPKILRNKASGIVEHEFLKWLSWEEMYDNTYQYLKPAITWAKNKILNENNNSS